MCTTIMDPIEEDLIHNDNNELEDLLKTSMTKDKVLISLRKSLEIQRKANDFLNKLLDDCKSANKKIDVNESRLFK